MYHFPGQENSCNGEHCTRDDGIQEDLGGYGADQRQDKEPQGTREYLDTLLWIPSDPVAREELLHAAKRNIGILGHPSVLQENKHEECEN